MRRALILTVALVALTMTPALAQGVRLKAVIHHARPNTPPCTAAVTSPLDFLYDSISDVGQFATGAVTITCSPAQFVTTIAISAGNANQFVPYREMWKNGSDSSHILEYNIYTTTNYNIVWGDGTGGSSVKTLDRSVTSFRALVLAELQFPQSAVTAGQYSDVVTVTFNIS